jgi:hypothetical protein
MKKTVWGLLWSSFIAVLPSWVGVVVAISLSFVAWKIPPNTPIPVYWLVLILIVAILVMAICLKAANTAFEEYQKLRLRNIPNIWITRKEQSTDSILCVLEYSEIFAHDMMVSAYYTNQDDIEVLIATGFVENVQNNGKILIKLNNLEPGQKEILKKFANNDKSIINRTIIKPGISKKIFNKLLSNTQFN